MTNFVSEDQPSRSVLVADTTPLADVRDSRKQMLDAKAAFIATVERAASAGETNVSIALSAGMTEGGIRMLLKRRRKP